MSAFHEHAPNVKKFQFLEKKDQIFRKIIRENFGNVQIMQKNIQNYSVVSLGAVLLERSQVLKGETVPPGEVTSLFFLPAAPTVGPIRATRISKTGGETEGGFSGLGRLAR